MGLLVYLRSPYVFPATVSAIPPTSKDPSSSSELARASTQCQASAAASASASAAAGNDDDQFAAFWSRFDENVMQHLVWPAVLAGEITQAPKPHRDNPTWWTDGIAPIFEDERVYSLHWKGGKRKAKSCWTHVCAELAPYEFARVERREAFRQTNADEFLVAAGYVASAAARNSTGTDDRKQGEAGAAHLTAPAAASVSAGACRNVVEEAFWLEFAANVMEQLVWPALRAGEITKAPKAHVDNPTWWTDGIVPILENERVYQLHWKGSKKKAKRCWTFVCDQLAGEVFVPPEAGEAFTQKTWTNF